MDFGTVEVIISLIGGSMIVFGIIGWIKKKEILTIYKGVFGRISSLIVAFCFLLPAYVIISNIFAGGELTAVGIVLSLLKFWIIAAAVYFFYIKRRCPESKKRGLLLNVLLCGMATILQIVLFAITFTIWIMELLFGPKKRYVEYNGQIYEVVD